MEIYEDLLEYLIIYAINISFVLNRLDYLPAFIASMDPRKESIEVMKTIEMRLYHGDLESFRSSRIILEKNHDYICDDPFITNKDIEEYNVYTMDFII